jgi:uncharacterized protein (DUF433 family)
MKGTTTEIPGTIGFLKTDGDPGGGSGGAEPEQRGGLRMSRAAAAAARAAAAQSPSKEGGAETPSREERIVSTPGVRGGKPRIAGHRITVADIAIWHERMGMSPDEIVSAYPSITLSDVHSALAYYYDDRDEIDRSIREGEEYAESMRAKHPSLVAEKLKARKTDAPDDPLPSR